jgi:hypothetical protein
MDARLGGGFITGPLAPSGMTRPNMPEVEVEAKGLPASVEAGLGIPGSELDGRDGRGVIGGYLIFCAA